MHLGRARLTRTSLEANGSICRGMLQHRYDTRPGSVTSPRGREGGPVKAVRLHEFHQQPVIDEVPEPGRQRPARRRREDRRGRRLPHRPAHHGGPVGRGHGHAAALHPGARERGWVHEVGSAVTNVAVGDTVILHPTTTCGLCRACRAGDDMHCTGQRVPRPVPRRRDGRVPAHLGPGLRQAGPRDPAAGRGGAGRRGHHRLPRGPQGPPAALPGHDRRGDRRGRAGPHRHPVPGRAVRDHRRRGGPEPGRAQAGRAARRAATPWSPTAARWTRSRT